jgi:hypothetical protein
VVRPHRANPHRSRPCPTELAARDAASGRDDQLITAEEWLTTQAEAQRAEDQHRQITDDTDLADLATERAADEQSIQPAPHPDAADTALTDIRETTAAEPPQTGEDTIRIPTATETADTVARAQRALAEIEQRRIQDERAAADQARADQLNRWHANDQQAQRAAEQADELDRATPALELSTTD